MLHDLDLRQWRTASLEKQLVLVERILLHLSCVGMEREALTRDVHLLRAELERRDALRATEPARTLGVHPGGAC